jgi:hypothetical protein
MHRVGNVLDKLPKQLQPKAKAALQEIMKVEFREAAVEEIESLRAELGAKYPKAIESLCRDQDKLLTFFNFPAEHWVHIRTSNLRTDRPPHAPSGHPRRRPRCGDRQRGRVASGMTERLQTMRPFAQG